MLKGISQIEHPLYSKPNKLATKLTRLVSMLTICLLLTSVKTTGIELESDANLESDYEFCIEKFPKLPEMVKAYNPETVGTNSTEAGKFGSVLVSESKTIAFFLFPDLTNYITSNFTTLLPWLSVLLLASLGLLTCTIYSIISCCTKEKFVINDE